MNLKSTIGSICLVLGTLSMWAQDPNLPPSGNFDLTQWKITLPDQSEIGESQLSNGFESENEFFTDPITGAMVFVCRNDGQTGGSTYPRSELREMLRAGNTSISTKGIGLNNWVFSSSTLENQEASGGVDGTMTATVAVDHVSTTGESSRVGRVIIGQIHASDNEPCRIYYRKLPGNTKGSIYIAHEPNTTSEQWYEMIGSRSSSASDPADGIELGDKFSYEIKVVFNTLTVTIMRDGKDDVVQVVDMSNSGFEDDWMYFKAGTYNQNNGGVPGDYAQVSFFELDVTHTPPNTAPTVSITSPLPNVEFIEGRSIPITAEASDTDGNIEKVEFYQGNTWLGEDLTAPYSYTLDNVAEGSYTLTAVATDDRGSMSTSNEISVQVISQPTGYDAPYDIPRFQDFIGQCKLQAPTSSTIASQNDLVNGYSSDNFYVADGDKVAFNQSGSLMRTELRHLTNWTLSEGDRSLHGRLKFIQQTCDQVTVVQIHDDANLGSGPNKPLLRIYKHLTKPPVDHLWAAIKTDATGDNTTHIDLGIAPDDYFGFDVRLVGNNMIIEINGQEKANVDVSFWDFPSYWKAGVYLQDEGEASVHFDELYEGDGSQVNHFPFVSIAEPVNEQTFFSGDDITVNVEAFDTDGSVTLVEFFQGNQKLGEDNTMPYTFTWNSVPEGSYTLTAKATDDMGAVTTSLGVDVLVGVQYALTTTITGEGSISSDPPGGSYSENSIVRLMATPSSGYQFDGWGGDLSGRQNPISITMDGDKNVSASFIEIPTYSLSTSVVGGGSVTTSPEGTVFEEGTVVTLTAVPDSEFQFDNWSGSISGDMEVVEITMNSDKAVVATFSLIVSIDDELTTNEEQVSLFPNPASNSLAIEYTLFQPTSTQIVIQDMSGKKVKEWQTALQCVGTHQIIWTIPGDVKAGVYIIKLSIGDSVRSSRINLIKN